MDLLTLPLNVRQQIFTNVLLTPQPLPSDDTHASTNRILKDELTKEICNQYPCDLPPVYYSTLICVNKQIYSEIEDMVYKQKLCYKLDCLIGYCAIYPTWISIPRLSTTVDVVEANLRLSGRQAFSRGWTNGCRCCSGPGDLIYSFAALIVRFLEHGPSFLQGKNTKVGTLIVNVENNVPDDSTPEKSSDYMHSACLTRVLEEEISIMLSDGLLIRKLFHTVHEKVDFVLLKFDGQLVKEWKVHERT